MKNNLACKSCKFRLVPPEEEAQESCEIGFRQFPGSRSAIKNFIANKGNLCHGIAQAYRRARGEEEKT